MLISISGYAPTAVNAFGVYSPMQWYKKLCMRFLQSNNNNEGQCNKGRRMVF